MRTDSDTTLGLRARAWGCRAAVCALVAAAGLVALGTSGVERADAVPTGKWRGAIAGTVYGRRFRLRVSVQIGRRLRGERNPVHLAIGTSADPNAAIGSVLFVSAERFITPFTGRRVTLRYLRMRASRRSLSATLVDPHTREAAAFETFTAPNVCLTVYQPLYCLGLSGPEQFTFVRGARAALRFAGRRLTGSLSGRGGPGLIQTLPYPPVRYSARISARR